MGEAIAEHKEDRTEVSLSDKSKQLAFDEAVSDLTESECRALLYCLGAIQQ